ncbi:MAG TPA: hypothetical protein PLQ29_11980 [Spirochaetales bacterium]|nr:hypothetical protein [Spirochaetales bacterium]HPG87405.1 hypothetical protein [Spirochaetales bacterium]
MKKLGMLLAILLVAGVCAMADEAVAAQDDALFADIDAVALSQVEMEAVEGDGFGTFVIGAIVGGILYDCANDTTKELTGKTIKGHYTDAINKAVESAKNYYNNYSPNYDAPGPRARARARG